MKIKALIIDDELKAITSLQDIIARQCPKLEIVGSSTDPEEGIDLIRTHVPDVVFLDIEMPGMDGFTLLEKLNPVPFEVIFTTAFDKYALRAFRFSALDFLLKPIVPEELVEAVARIIKTEPASHGSINNLLNNWQQKQLKRLAIPDLKGISFVEVDDISCLEADGNYTIVHQKGGSRLVSSKTLKEYEQTLEGSNFFRTHHSFLTNLSLVQRFEKEDGGLLVMPNNLQTPVSRRRKAQLLELLGGSASTNY